MYSSRWHFFHVARSFRSTTENVDFTTPESHLTRQQPTHGSSTRVLWHILLCESTHTSGTIETYSSFSVRLCCASAVSCVAHDALQVSSFVAATGSATATLSALQVLSFVNTAKDGACVRSRVYPVIVDNVLGTRAVQIYTWHMTSRWECRKGTRAATALYSMYTRYIILVRNILRGCAERGSQ